MIEENNYNDEFKLKENKRLDYLVPIVKLLNAEEKFFAF